MGRTLIWIAIGVAVVLIALASVHLAVNGMPDFTSLNPHG